MYSNDAIVSEMERLGFQAYGSIQSPARRLATRALSHLGLLRNFRRSGSPLFVSLMGVMEYILFPVCYWTEIIPYCYDCWPPVHDKWAQFFRRHRVRSAMFSCRQAAEEMQRRFPSMRCGWIPEALTPADYDQGKVLAARRIDVLELGRRDEPFHESITGYLQRTGRVHLYMRAPGEIIFPQKEDFLKAFSDSKISICFPSSMTHPEISGGMETLTLRYLESMVCRCVVVGHCPRELEELFGYNPVIESNPDQAIKDIEDILQNPEKYQPLVERNRLSVLKHCTWSVRVREMLNFLMEPRPASSHVVNKTLSDSDHLPQMGRMGDQ